MSYEGHCFSSTPVKAGHYTLIFLFQYGSSWGAQSFCCYFPVHDPTSSPPFAFSSCLHAIETKPGSTNCFSLPIAFAPFSFASLVCACSFLLDVSSVYWNCKLVDRKVIKAMPLNFGIFPKYLRCKMCGTLGVWNLPSRENPNASWRTRLERGC